MKNKKRIPVNMSIEEEVKFWEENDLYQYIDDTYEEDVQLSRDLKNEIISSYYNRKTKVSITKSPLPKLIFQVTTSSSEGVFNCEPSCNSADNQAVVHKEVCNI